MDSRHVKMIDDVLEFLYKNRRNGINSINNYAIEDIHNKLKNDGIDIDKMDVYFIIEKLSKEGYVYCVDGDVPYYTLNFDGILLKEQNGYKQKIEKEDTEFNSLKLNHKKLIHEEWKIPLGIFLGCIVSALLTVATDKLFPKPEKPLPIQITVQNNLDSLYSQLDGMKAKIPSVDTVQKEKKKTIPSQ